MVLAQVAPIYSPGCLEGVFPETQLPVYGVLGNLGSGMRCFRKLGCRY